MKRTMGILLGIVVAAVVVVSVFFSAMKDDKGPEISFGDNVPVYQGPDNESVLLSNVTAKDDRDGDVTDSVYVDSVYVSTDGTRATVTYVAMDSKHNVTKASQKVECEVQQDRTAQQREAGTPDETQTNEGTTEPAAENTDSTDHSQENQNPEAPVITLNASEVTIGVNDVFAYNDYIESITDDVDDFDTLSRRLHLDGDYDSNKAGTYEVHYSVVDTDGNASNDAVLTLIRQ